MNPDTFRNSPSGRLIKAGQGEAEYWAFVPQPLPPQLPPDAELMRIMLNAAYALGELAALGRNMSNPRLLIGPFVRREAVLSSRIEGTQAGIADLYAYEAGQLPLPGLGKALPAGDVQEVANYVTALEYGLDRLQTLPISLRLIREVHERLLQGVRGEHATPGEFRRSQNWIGSPGCSINDASYVPPPVPQMNEGLDAFEKYLHADDPEHPPLERLAFIHYQFEAIHPFIDGNGRIGRLLISLLLVGWDLLPSPLLYLSDYFERNRDRYYDLLMAVSTSGAWRDWVLFFLQGIDEQARDASYRLKRLQDLQSDWHHRLSKVRVSALPLALADHLFSLPVLTIPQARDLLDVTYRSAQLNVEKLVHAGILKQIGESRYGKTFVAEEIFRIIMERRQ